ncbi:septum formation inhibitor Maf [Candidatus Parcubacteria bacterium]|nr:MAG: septum formation inhibitor Maf [Candidatus Parcubacteria bacterium]
MRRIILASKSPRRESLLKQIGLKFEIDPSKCKEQINPKLKPHELVKSLSLQKAKEVAKRHKNAIIIASDTLNFLGNKILGKPKNAKDAKTILKKESGKAHTVITGFTIIDTSNQKTYTGSTKTKVYFKRLSEKEIDSYIATEEPLDKAGGYGIQSLGSIFIKKIEGDYYNVVGLPIFDLTQALRKFGIEIL